MLPPIAVFASPKAALRERMKAVRRAAAAERPDAARHAAANFLSRLNVEPGMIVALYHPIKDEIDPGPLAAELTARGARLALPAVLKPGAPLVFRAHDWGAPLSRGWRSLVEPPKEAPELRPDIVVAPLLAFTRRGERLGYGGGFYDRTLRALRAAGRVTAAGLAYGAQEVDALPAGPLDEPLDFLVTEREAFRAEQG